MLKGNGLWQQGWNPKQGDSGPRRQRQMSDKCPNRHFAQNTGKHQQSNILPIKSVVIVSTCKAYMIHIALYHYQHWKPTSQAWLHAILGYATSRALLSPPHPLTGYNLEVTSKWPRSDLEVTSLQFSWESALGGASRSPLCGETGARRSPSNFTGRRRSGTGLALPTLLRSLFAREWPRIQQWLPPSASPGATRACVGGWVQKYPQANPERGKAEQVGNGEQWSVWSRWQGRPWCGVTAGNHRSPGRTCEISPAVLTSSNPPASNEPDQGMTDGGHWWCRVERARQRS